MPYITQDDYTAMMAPFTIEVIAFAGTVDERTFDAIFDNWHQAYGDDLELSGVKPELYCLESNVVGMVQEDTITIDGVDYKIRDVQEDGIGIIKLELKKA